MSRDPGFKNTFGLVRPNLVLATLAPIMFAACSQGADIDVCTEMCRRLDDCGLCLTDAQDNCLLFNACKTDCDTDASTMAAAACINRSSGCDKAAFNTCLSGGGQQDGGGPVPVGAWTFTGQGTFKEIMTYYKKSASCAVQVQMTATVNAKVAGWVELNFQHPECVCTVGDGPWPEYEPYITCTKKATLAGKSYYASSYDKAKLTVALQESSLEGAWLKGSFDSTQFKAQGSTTRKPAANTTRTTIMDIKLYRQK